MAQAEREPRDDAPRNEPTPEDLVARFVAGDDAAFTALVARVGDRLYGFVCRFVGDRHRAEDVYQAVLVKVARHAATYDRRARFTTWLYRVARNACLDALRYDARRRAVSLDASADAGEGGSMLDALPSDDPPPESAAARAELGGRIAEAVAGLPEEQREVFLLKEEGALTFDEIGDLLGCGRETAKSRMRYALERLRNALGREGRQYGLLEPKP